MREKLGNGDYFKKIYIFSFSEDDVFAKEFECPVCMDDMKPPTRIFQCRNGHVICENCKAHPELNTCPSCRIPLTGKVGTILVNFCPPPLHYTLPLIVWLTLSSLFAWHKAAVSCSANGAMSGGVKMGSGSTS